MAAQSQQVCNLCARMVYADINNLYCLAQRRIPGEHTPDLGAFRAELPLAVGGEARREKKKRILTHGSASPDASDALPGSKGEPGENPEIDAGCQDHQIAADYDQTISLDHADGEQQDRISGQGVGKGDEAEWQHQQHGGKDQRQPVDPGGDALGGQELQARFDDFFDPRDHAGAFAENAGQLARIQFPVEQEFWQPGHSVECDADADQDDACPEHRADTGDRDWQQEGDRHQRAQEQQTVLANQIQQLAQRNGFRVDGINRTHQRGVQGFLGVLKILFQSCSP